MTDPTDLAYTREHEWLRRNGETATVGITAFAADALGDIVYVQLPDVGAQVTAGQGCGEIESTKSVSDLFAPADGTVLDVNDALSGTPDLVNTDPYGNGWLFRMRLAQEPALLDAAEYAALVGGGQ